MRAAVCTRYGPPEVLQLREVDKPVPRDDEVLIQIRATTVTSSDWFISQTWFDANRLGTTKPAGKHFSWKSIEEGSRWRGSQLAAGHGWGISVEDTNLVAQGVVRGMA